ncbi:MAG: hypothetical protein JWN07_2587 [Hyphomicrobiales bacterium]|nr:hypothetical protein [Hyphomicrobiales bacterium]
MVFATFQTGQLDLSADYDARSDVFYIVLGEDGPVESEGAPEGVDLDFRLDTEEPCGVTVLGYRRDGWPKRLDELAGIAARHLAVSPDAVLSLIRHANAA